MKGERLARAKSAFLGAADTPIAERGSVLDEACDGDHELRDFVERLLARHDRGMGTFLEMPGGTEVMSRTEDLNLRQENASELPTIPGYEILRLVGEGGMGSVYEAKQEQPRRSVALKIIRGGAYVSEHQVRLFQREVESLARLNHPSIAAIHDAGRTPFGQHYFTMELVQGEPLSTAMRLDSGFVPSRAELHDRLQLFLEICEAIQYAHQRGVIHRDLKPSNVLATGHGESTTGSRHHRPRIKVLDFGLARITDADVSLTTAETDVGKIQGTLAYMSPEQARGDPSAIDTRTDVYSLGVILYEFMTGQRPYDVGKTFIHEAVRVIVEQEPKRPSTVVRPLRGDLETIALKALEKDPERRYPSVAALAEDVERYLTSQPILARPPSTIYQIKKLVARHKAPAAFAATLFVVLIAATITMTILYQNQRRARLRAEAANLLALGRLEESSSGPVAFALASLELVDVPRTRIFALETLWRGPTGITLPRRGKYPSGIDFSPDGRHLAVGHWKAGVFRRNEIGPWKSAASLLPAGGGEPVDLVVPDEDIEGVYFGLHSDVLYTFSDTSDSLRVWSVPEGKRLAALGFDEPPDVSMSVDRQYLITRTGAAHEQENRIRIEVWDLAERVPGRVGERTIDASRPEGMGVSATLASVDSEGLHLVYAKDRVLELVSLADLSGPARIVGVHEESIRGVAFHPDGDRIAAADGSGENRIWSLARGPSSPVQIFPGQPGFWGPLRFGPGGARLATTGENGMAQVWDLEGPPDQDPIEFGNRSIFAMRGLAFHPGGRLIVTAQGGWPVIRVLGAPYPWVLRGHTREVTGVVFGPDGSWIASQSADEIRTWALTPGSMSRGCVFRGEFKKMAVDPKSRFLLASGTGPEEKLRVLSLENGSLTELPTLPDGRIFCGAVGPRGRLVAAGYWDGNCVVQIQDMETGETRILDPGETVGVGQLEFLPDGRLLSARENGKFRLWNLEDGTHEVLGERIWRFAVSRDSRFLLTLQVGPWVALRDLEAGTVRELRSHGRGVRGLAFDPTGSLAITSDSQGIIRVGPVTGEEPHLLLGHEGAIEAVAVSPDGQWIASAGADQTVRVWSMPEGQPLHTLPREEFLDHLRRATNVRAVPDDESATGYSLRIEAFRGWEEVARW